MKRIIVLLFAIVFAANDTAYSQTNITMGAGYADDVYYSLMNGFTTVVPRTEWDIGFYTDPSSTGIIVNDGANVELRKYAYGDTTAWMAIDTNGLSQWPILFNGVDSWENGAFNRHAGDHPDYGWGVYDPQSEDIIGDSIYIIKLQDTTYRKLWIVRKESGENKYIIRFANLDNSQEREMELSNNDYLDKNFSYFEFEGENFFDREPDSEDWDILFTKYQVLLQPQGLYFSVVGVLNNTNTYANRFHPVPLYFQDWFQQPFDSSKVVIGYNWKWFDLNSFTWNLEDSLVFFIQAMEGSIFKLYFTHYAGTSSGDIEFEDEMVSVVDVADPKLDDQFLQLSPNPASAYVNLKWSNDLGSIFAIRVFDLNGKEVLNREINSINNSYRINVSGLKKGIYIVNLISGDSVINEKLLIE